jgi:hypothetical protein
VRSRAPRRSREPADRAPLFQAEPVRPARTDLRRAASASPLDEAVRIRLGAALERLSPQTRVDALAVLAPFARALEPDEVIEHVAQGWSKGLMCLVGRTDRRLLVVIDRFPEPVVEALPTSRTSISLYGPPGTDRVSLAVVDRRRLLEVTGIRDRAEAAALATSGPGGAAVSQYF